METNPAKQKSDFRRIAFIALFLLLAVLVYAAFSAWQQSHLPVETLIPGTTRLSLTKPYIIADVVGIILAIQGSMLLRKKQWHAAFALFTVASVLLVVFMVLCRQGVINP